MIGSKVLEFIEHLSLRKITDTEMLGDLVFVKDELTKAYQTLKYIIILLLGFLTIAAPLMSTLLKLNLAN